MVSSIGYFKEENYNSIKNIIDDSSTEYTCKILFIGSSYFNFNNLPYLFENFAIGSGKDVYIDQRIPGGWYLENHANSDETISKINELDWDYIILQGVGSLMAYPDYFTEHPVLSALENLRDMIYENCESTKIIFCLPWAFEDGMTWYQNWTDTYEDMQIKIFENTLQYSDEIGFKIAPVGWSWYKVLKEENYPLHYLHMSDWNHPSIKGSYLMACVIFSTVYLESSVDIPFYGGLIEDEAQYFQNIASDTVFDNLRLWKLVNETGSLSGYVEDIHMNPIEGVRARVYFHETFEEDFTDETGYYHVINIPECWCLKNVTVSKTGYKTEKISLSISNNTQYDFILTPTNTIYVDNDGGADYTKIQDAINNASEDDTIFVYNGIYYEYLQINKSIDLIGENKQKTIVDGNGRGDVICLKSSNVNIINFTIRNASIDDGHHRGIFQRYDPENNFPHIENIAIKDCIIKNNGRAMTLDSISNLLIENCEILVNPSCSILFGIFAENYTFNNISINNCTFRNNGINLPDMGNKSGGIHFFGNDVNCSDIIISNCLFFDSILFGIYMESSKNIEVSNNVIMNSTQFGIWLNNIENLELYNNSVTKAGMMGIGLSNVKNANVKYNYVYGNGLGEFWNGGMLIQHYSENITIINNNFKDNDEFGLLILTINQSTIIENNFINNIKNLHFIQSQPYNIILDNNYWDRNRFFPFLIFGLDENYWFIPRIIIDWNPAKEPYDISIPEVRI